MFRKDSYLLRQDFPSYCGIKSDGSKVSEGYYSCCNATIPNQLLDGFQAFKTFLAWKALPHLRNVAFQGVHK